MVSVLAWNVADCWFSPWSGWNKHYQIEIESFESCFVILTDGQFNYLCNYLLVELPTEFTKPLTEQTVIEKETVCLECEVTKPNKPAKWFKNGKEIKQDDNVKFVTFDNTHRLIIKSAVLDDEAEYAVEIDGKTSKTHLYVDGMYLKNFIWSDPY